MGAAQELSRLARALHDKPTPELYQQLLDFADQRSHTEIGARAALALGYYDYTRAEYPSARKWLEKAADDTLLVDYALYWQALTDRAMGANDLAVNELKRFRQLYPKSVMSDAAVEQLAQAALAAGRPEDAVAALTGYPRSTARASLVLLRAQAREKAAADKNELPFAAAADYLDLVYRFPLSDEAKTGLDKIPYLRLTLGEQFPGTPLETEVARAEALYDARRWKDMRAAYQELLPKLSGEAHERATLRLAQADLQSGAPQDELASLALTDPELDAERNYLLSQVQRSAKAEDDMFATIEKLATTRPQSPWTEEALYAAGNYHWVTLDRDRAVEFYQRVVAGFPTGRYASISQWHVVWTAYLERQPEVAVRLEQFLRQYPTSPLAVDALYWLGRSNERAGASARARSLYRAAVSRFPQTYFAARAKERLRAIGSQPTEPVDVASVIPPVPPLPPWSPKIPDAATGPWTRAQALQSIAFESSAELELRAAYADTHAPRLLLAAAEAAVEARHYAAGMVATRQLVPELEARRLDDVPDEAWRTVYPLPYREPLEAEARRNHVDPMLVAGLIRQESAFAADAVSVRDAVGLMQMEPSTGSILAKRLRVKFSRARLFDPEYNLRLGTVYLSDLLSTHGTPEAALAAYNAGEDRVILWTTGQNYSETPEFVESIPFTQTREYVQIVLRNAELYRQIYAHAAPSAPALPDEKLDKKPEKKPEKTPRKARSN
jgi:soluble lytic murein transglycosylase